MRNPYDILGIGLDANNEAMRARYLELVRQFPPERAPEQFADIRWAYDQLRDPVGRLKRILFEDHHSVGWETLLAQQKRSIREHRLSVARLLGLGKS